MNIFEILGKEGYLELQFNDYDKDIDLIQLLIEDTNVINKWGEPKIDIITKGKKGDCPYFWVSTGLVVISEKAKDELHDIWEKDNIELLPLKYNDTYYYLLHITKTQNISYNMLNEYDIELDKEEYNKLKIYDKYLFRAYDGEYASPTIFANDKFVERIKNSDLKGFEFRRIWEG